MRLAAGLSKVWTECSFDGGYDLSVGTSEKGEIAQDKDFVLPSFKHLIIVFGGVGGLEDSVTGDQALPAARPEELGEQQLLALSRALGPLA